MQLCADIKVLYISFDRKFLVTDYIVLLTANCRGHMGTTNSSFVRSSHIKRKGALLITVNALVFTAAFRDCRSIPVVLSSR